MRLRIGQKPAGRNIDGHYVLRPEPTGYFRPVVNSIHIGGWVKSIAINLFHQKLNTW